MQLAGAGALECTIGAPSKVACGFKSRNGLIVTSAVLVVVFDRRRDSDRHLHL